MNERRIHRLFEVSVLLKGAHALLECIGGLALAFVSTDMIVAFIKSITQHELLEDRHDLIATNLMKFAQNFSVSSQNFYAFYLLSYGAIKFFLIVGLLQNRLWAYPASLAVMGLFIVYQLYRFSYNGSPGLIALTVLDLVVVVLIWHEYRLMLRHTSG